MRDLPFFFVFLIFAYDTPDKVKLKQGLDSQPHWVLDPVQTIRATNIGMTIYLKLE